MIKYIKYIVMVIVIVAITIICIKCCDKHRTEIEIQKQLDSIEYKIDSIQRINDSLQNNVNLSESILNTIENDFEKEYIYITNSNLDSLYKFFSDYTKREGGK